MSLRAKHSDNAAYVLVAPAAGFITVFVLIPLLAVVTLAFCNVNLISNAFSFIGFNNFAIELSSQEFTVSIRNTLIYACLTIIPSMCIGLLIALLINGLKWGQSFWRSVYFLPSATTLVAMSAVWRWMFHPDVGIADQVLGTLLHMHNWLSNPNLALAAIAVVGNWHQIGLIAILYLAALASVPRAPYESAIIDGANAWQRFSNVTWPAVGPTTLFAFNLSAGNALQAYDTIAAMTQGGPLDSTTTLTYAIWVRGIHFFDIGRASVLSLILLVLSLIVIILQRTGYGARLERGGSR